MAETMVQKYFTSGMDFRQKLIPKQCLIKIPNDSSVTNSQLRGKQFKFSQISASEGEFERLRQLDSTFTENVVEIMILYSTITTTKDRLTNSITAMLEGYKKLNSKVLYNGEEYVIKAEINNPYNNSLTLICDTIK